MTYNVGMVSLGCDKNRVDAEIMLSKLSKNGYNIVNDEKEADILIVNTCGFIESAKTESVETILEMAQNKREGRCKSIIVTGCLAERYKDELISEMPEINAIIGTGNYGDICEVIENTLEGKNGIVNTGKIDYNFEYEDRIITTPSHYAYLKIAEGCNNNCSYCIIPKLRGGFRSRTIESIVYEAQELSNKGIRELILVAQDTTMYGIDIYGKKMISDLLIELEKIEGIEWIRLMYTYPEEITDDLIKVMKNSKKICHYFDMPIQHVSNNILKLMKRRSTNERITSLINKVRREIPDIVIRTSIIVGFPTESENDFEELKDFIKNYKLGRVGIFTYSAEEDTEAAGMSNQIDDKIKEQRKDMLMSLQSRISLENNNLLVGKVIDVIIDGISSKSQYMGRTYGDAPEIDQTIYVNSKDRILNSGDIVKVIVIKAYTYDLVGDVYYESGK